MPLKRKRVVSDSKKIVHTKRAKEALGSAPDEDLDEDLGSKHEDQVAAPNQESSIEKAQPVENDFQKYWLVERIVRERNGKYLFDWKDGPNGERYSNSWEPKRNATEAAVTEFKARQAARRCKGKGKKSVTGGRKSSVAKSVAKSIAKPEKGFRPRKAEKYRKPRVVVTSSVPEEEEDEEDEVEEDQEGLGLDQEIYGANDKQEGKEAYEDYVEPASEQDLVSERFLEEVNGTTAPLSPTVHSSGVEVRISPLRERDEYEELDSPQLITGTQPQQNSSQDSPQSQPLVDAAAAPNLTQKHSQYDPEDTSKSTEDTTGSAVATSSLSEDINTATQQFASSAIIPDSQSLLDSTSYIPSGDKTGESSKDSSNTASDLAAVNRLTLSQATTDSQAGPDTQVVPESSFLQTNADNADNETLEDSWTQSAEFIEEDQLEAQHNPIERSSVAEDVVDQLDYHQSPEEGPSPTAERSLSSASSPPPETESADKSQPLSQSQTRSASYTDSQPQPRSVSESQHQAAQLVGSIEASAPTFDGDASAASSQHTDRETEQLSASLGTTDRVAATSIEHNTLPRVRSRSPARLTTDRRASQSSSLTPEIGIQSRRQNQRLAQNPLSGLNSSPLPSVPSQVPAVIGESAPPRPQVSSLLSATPYHGSVVEMDPSTPQSEKSLKSTLAALHKERELRRAERHTPKADAPRLAIPSITPASAVPARLQSPAVDRDLRSPSVASVVPPNEVIPEEAPEDYSRSERFQTLLPEQSPQTIGNQGTAATRFTEASAQAGVLDSNQHVLAIDLGEIQRDQYKQTIAYEREAIDKFLTQIWPEESHLFGKAQHLVQQLRHILTHADLINEETFTQASYVEPDKKAQWDVDYSAKFRFLQALLVNGQPFDFSTAIVVEPGRLSNILQTFLQGSNISHMVAGHEDVFMDKPSVIIFHTDTEQSLTVPPPDLIIALDGNLSNEVVGRAQATLSRVDEGNDLVPFFTLVVPKSVEHIERIMPTYSSEAERLHVLVSTIASLRSEAGRPEDGALSMEDLACRLIDSLVDADNYTVDTTLPEIQLMSPAVSSQNSTQGDSTEGSLNAHGTKRPFDDYIASMPNTKKSRVNDIADNTDPSTINPQDMDISHVSESVPSQALPDVAALQARLQEHITALEKLQFENEEQRAILFDTQGALEKAQRITLAANARAENLQAVNTNLRTQNNVLKTELSASKAALLDHSIPERRSFEVLQASLAASTAEATKNAKQAATLSADLDYLRSNYQTASNSATTLAQENRDLTTANALLEQQASSERTRAREMTLSGQNASWTQEKRRLKLELDNRNTMCQRLSEEVARLRESARGRMGTRASSVPRSPRVGSRPSSPPVGESAAAGGSGGAAKKPSRLRQEA